MEKGAQIGQGRTAEVYAWGEDQILKLYQEHIPGHLVEQEFIVTQAAQAAGLPVPAVDRLVQVDGRCGIVFERLEGPSMLKDLAARPWKLFPLARQLGQLHAQIHTSSMPPGMPSQYKQIEKGIEAASDLPQSIKTASQACLAALPAGEALCHGDFHPDNVLLTARGPVIIDWMTGTRGHPLADVCRTLLLFQTTALPPGIPLPMRLMMNASRALIQAVYLNRYLQIHPASRQQINAWQLPLMAARLREVEQYPREKQLLLARIQTALKASASKEVA
jgi:aminoglycoside phosphotransferase (APT) family kinase protein